MMQFLVLVFLLPIAHCNQYHKNGTSSDNKELKSPVSMTSLHNETLKGRGIPHADKPNKMMNPEELSHFDLEDVRRVECWD